MNTFLLVAIFFLMIREKFISLSSNVLSQFELEFRKRGDGFLLVYKISVRLSFNSGKQTKEYDA